MISLEFDPKAIKSLEKSLSKAMARIATEVGITIYNRVIQLDAPVWSGAYMASWTISAGTPDTNGRVQTDPDNPYPRLGYGANIKSQPYEPVYVSNYVVDAEGNYYAGLVEYEGTPSSDFTPWMNATYTKNEVVRTFKYSKNLY